VPSRDRGGGHTSIELRPIITSSHALSPRITSPIRVSTESYATLCVSSNSFSVWLCHQSLPCRRGYTIGGKSGVANANKPRDSGSRQTPQLDTHHTLNTLLRYASGVCTHTQEYRQWVHCSGCLEAAKLVRDATTTRANLWVWLLARKPQHLPSLMRNKTAHSDMRDPQSNGRSEECLCGLVVRVPGYRSRGPGFDSWRYHIF
jgi:hypothetical protein